MMLISIMIVGVGTFCIANSNATFISVAFIVGLALLIMGICELVVNRVTVVQAYETEKDVNAEGFTAVIIGIVFLSGQITEYYAVTAIFALWITEEGLKAFSSADFNIRTQSLTDTFTKLLGVIMTLLGVYMFFNSRLLNLPALMEVGAAMFLLGLSRFRIALAIEYQKPDVLTGNQEKLEDAKRDEKRAMQKAKEGIRETKIARARIEKVKKAIQKEESMLRLTERRRSKDE